MDEENITRLPELNDIRNRLKPLLECLSTIDPSSL
jgi:hypothetical protein